MIFGQSFKMESFRVRKGKFMFTLIQYGAIDILDLHQIDGMILETSCYKQNYEMRALSPLLRNRHTFSVSQNIRDSKKLFHPSS
jgi:hypothetical protein